MKLKYIETEAKHKAQLEKLQTLKELDMAEAKVDATVKVEEENEHFDLDDNLPDDKSDYVEKYVQSHKCSGNHHFSNHFGGSKFKF